MHGSTRCNTAWKAGAVLLMAILSAGTQVGCGSANRYRRAVRPVATKRATVGDLASRLGLEIVESSPARATLRRGAHIVMLFPEPGGRAYVDGKPVRLPGGQYIVAGARSVQFPWALIDRIDAALPEEPVKPSGPKALRPDKPRPKPRQAKLGRVIIDPGHGGRDVGTDVAVRLYGIRLYEKTVNLSVAQAVAKTLKLRGAEVYMTRTRDTFVSLDDRVYAANHLKPKLFVSIHANSMPRTSMRGFLVLRPALSSADSIAAAGAIERHLTAIGMSGEVRKDVRDLRVLRKTTCPAVLVEMAYLSNRYDAIMLTNPKARARIATAIADAVTEYLRKRPPSRRR